LAKPILVVDDSGAVRSFVQATLEANEDVEVHAAPNGFEALRLLPRTSYRLVIIDINMSEINGLELISMMRKNERYRATPLMVISSEPSGRGRERALALGASAYLEKPFSPEQLLETVRQLMAGGE
jgi:two-component system chemotaxis response regulator CheY